jgi:sulfonate transport system permease protein
MSVVRAGARFLAAATLPVTLLVVWWFASANSTSVYFPALERITESFVDLWMFSNWETDVLPSLRRMAIGLAIAATAGIALGTLIGMVPLVRRATGPYVEFMRAIPPAALIPAAILAIGTGDSMKIAIVAFGAVWPILLNTIDGVRSVHPTLLATIRSYNVGRVRAVFKVVLPAAGPQISAGLRTALSLGIILIVVSEMVASTNGLGYFILNSQRTFTIAPMWSGIILLGLLGVTLNAVYVLVERLVLRWYWQSQKLER